MRTKPLRHLLIVISATLLAVFTSCNRIDKTEYTAEGVSGLLAAYRNETVSQVRYFLSFSINEGKESPVEGTAVIEFSLTSRRHPLVIDFRAPDNHLRSVTVNGRSVEASLTNGHIIIEGDILSRRFNRVEIAFRAGDMSLNRNDDYLYTLFVPDRASTAFPCFDQPDIKALFTLELEMPGSYRAMSNSPAVSSDTTEGRVTLRFAETKPLSTYLFAFAAGEFEIVEKETDGMKMTMLHRETRPGYIENNADEIFMLHYNAVRWLEDYTLIPYPFDKFGFVLIPSFQYSGMEHPGSIFYRASSLLLEAAPTLNERLSRASLIAHETSHIWFGDLVTMKWFDDVWLKEVFAGYMSDKITGPGFPDVNHDLRFLLSRYPPAYAVDRTRGTNPVIQKLGNMKDAGSLYGAIIYNKAPIVMRQLESLAGEESLRKGLQVYLKENSWGNARWDDLIAILEKTSKKPLGEWSRMWIREAGMPVIKPAVTAGENGFTLSFREDDPAGALRHWPQTLNTMIITGADTVTGDIIPGDRKSTLTIPDRPLCIIPDISGRAYGTFLFDSLTTRYLTCHINEFSDPLLRGITWINLYENLVNSTIPAADFYHAAFAALGTEDDPQLINYLAGRFSSVWWDLLTEEDRLRLADKTEKMILGKIISSDSGPDRRTWYGLYSSVVISSDGMAGLKEFWRKGELPGGTRLSEDEQCTLALTLALKGDPGAQQILAAQHDRITSAERVRRFGFVTPSVSSDPDVRDAFFNSLSDPVNREHEPWVLEALGYLHHPLVADRSEKYILPSLELLEEIKSTGDIFFPGSWISTTLAGHHSQEAKVTVEKFLDDHPDYPPDLRLKILQAADHLFRDGKQ
jgi:aminopeptidase N